MRAKDGQWYIIDLYGGMEMVAWQKAWEGHVEVLLPWSVSYLKIT